MVSSYQGLMLAELLVRYGRNGKFVGELVAWASNGEEPKVGGKSTRLPWFRKAMKSKDNFQKLLSFKWGSVWLLIRLCTHIAPPTEYAQNSPKY
eukprot:6483182-Amphidinium_carterae.1